MKKTYQVNISGRGFTIDEDAYALLLDYLDSLGQVFRDADGEEIVADIEGRISELLSEMIAERGSHIVTRADVDTVIERVGRAADFVEEGSENAATPRPPEMPHTAVPPAPPIEAQIVPKKCYRCAYDRVLGGVLAGLGIYLGWNINLMRIVLVAAGFFTGFFPLFLIYCILWICIPLAKTPELQLEQLGRPVNVQTISEMVREDKRYATAPSSPMQVIGNILMGGLGIICGSIGAGVLIALVVMIGIGCAELLSTTPHFNTPLGDFMNWTAWWCAVSALIAVLIPCIALTWATCSVFFKTRGASLTLWIIGLILFVAALAGIGFTAHSFV